MKKKSPFLPMEGSVKMSVTGFQPGPFCFESEPRHTLTVKGETLVLHTEWDLESPWKHVSGRVWGDISRKN